MYAWSTKCSSLDTLWENVTTSALTLLFQSNTMTAIVARQLIVTAPRHAVHRTFIYFIFHKSAWATDCRCNDDTLVEIRYPASVYSKLLIILNDFSTKSIPSQREMTNVWSMFIMVSWWSSLIKWRQSLSRSFPVSMFLFLLFSE